MSPPTPHSLHAAYEAERSAAARRGARVTAWCALALIPLFAYLDTVVFPEHEPLFFIWRVLTYLVAVAVLVLLRTPLGERHSLLLGVAMPLAVGLDVDAMTAVAGQESSPYYAGVMLVLFAASLLLPWPPSLAFVVSALLVGAYAAGIVASGPVADVPLFMTNVFLLIGTTVLVIVGAAMGERLRLQEFQGRRRLDEHARRQEAIAKLGQLALSAVAPNALMERAVALVTETLVVDLCEILERRPGEDVLRMCAGAGWRAGLVGQVSVDLNAPALPSRALAAGAPVVVEDLRMGSQLTGPSWLNEHGVVSAISVVIGSRERAFGVLGAYQTSRRAFAPEEVDFLEAVAGVLATAIVRERAEAALTEEVQTSTALARVGRELISSLETPVLLEHLCKLTCDVLAADYGVTWLWHAEEHVYVPSSRYGLSPEQWEALRPLKLPPSALTNLLPRLQREELVYVTRSSSEHPISARLLERHAGTLAVCIGFRKDDEIRGVQIAGYRGRVEPLTAQEERLARGIAQLATMALTNARLFEELERASQLKSEFVSTMSHELRTPLNVIVGYTDMLAEGVDAAESAQLLAQVRKSSLELLELIEATLDLGRITAGKDVPRVESVVLQALWDELRADFTTLAQNRGVALRWQPVGAIELVTDRRKLKIIMKNLVGNALKFTPAGEIVVACRLDGGACTFTVRDTGIGIPREHLSLIFDIFRQVDSSDARSYGGVGLGLYIVRSLLTQLGGDVEVESEPGRGSTFTVTLPAPTATGRASRAAS